MAMKTKEGLTTQSFMLTDEDIQLIEKTRAANGLTNKSAALRQLLGEASLFRQFKNGASEKAKRRVQSEIAHQIADSLAVDDADSASSPS